MTMHTVLGWLSVIGIVAFIIFAFRQGLGVKPDDRPDHGPSVGGPGDFTGHDSGGAGHG